jgi:hypothetical protein
MKKLLALVLVCNLSSGLTLEARNSTSMPISNEDRDGSDLVLGMTYAREASQFEDSQEKKIDQDDRIISGQNFGDMIDYSGVLDENDEEKLTVFAPIDASYPRDFIEKLMTLERQEELNEFLKHYIAYYSEESIGDVFAEIDCGKVPWTIPTLSGVPLSFEFDEDHAYVNGCSIVGYDETENGMVYYVDGLLYNP